MKFDDRIEIQAPVGVVWEFVRNPANLPSWNPKIRDVTPLSMGEPETGYRYRLTYVMSGRAMQCDAEIVEYSPLRRLQIRMLEREQTGTAAMHRKITEEFELTGLGMRTRLRHRVTVSGARIPVFFRILFWLLMHIGKPAGPRYLEKLKELVEAG